MNHFNRILGRRFYRTISLALLLPLSHSVFSQTAATFDINRYSTMGAGVFETFYVDATQAVQAALDNELISGDTLLLVTKTAGGNLALIRDQMAFHHIAQGSAEGLEWMATF